jgi:membrane-associated protease RseP (regulator of RpoE activity)
MLALCASSALAQDPSVDKGDGRESIARAQRALDDTRRPVDPKFLPGWERFCAEHADRSSCQVVMQRIGRKPVIGVVLAPDPQSGVRIAGVTPDGAAAGAGIRTGDRLVRIGGKAIAGATPEARVEEARTLLQAGDDKTPVTLAYARDGRENEVSLTPKLDSRLMVFTGDGRMMRPDGNVVVRQFPSGVIDITADRLQAKSLHGATGPGSTDGPHVFVFTDTDQGASDADRTTINRHVVRIECGKGDKECLKRAEAQAPLAIGGGPRVQMFQFDCKPGESCAGQQRLAEAFRWNGLNLASVDAQLGRYFGTDKGVLVLSAGPSLDPLQTGDVIQRVDGQAVDTPRAVMDALRDRPAESMVTVAYLRDRKPGTARVKVPKVMAFPAIPPAPPAPPLPPKAGLAPPAAPASATVVSTPTKRRIVMVDSNGQVQTWDDDGNDAMPMPPPALPSSPPVD